VIAGDITLARATELATKSFGGWSGGAAAALSVPAPVPSAPGRLYLVDRPDAAQTVVVHFLPAPSRTSPDYDALSLVDAVWGGGGFGTRLNLNLREKHGYSYAVFSNFNPLRTAGNWSTLDYMRQQAFYAESVGRIANARRIAMHERERLARLLGLFGADVAYKLPDKLPDVPQQTEDVGDIEARAINERFDIQMGKAEMAGLARSLGLTRTTRFLNVLETSYFRNSATGQPRQTGYEISLEIPLFDWGDAKVARAEYVYMQAADRLAELAVRARSDVREAYLDYRTAHDLALHFQKEVLPLRKQISEETVLRFNGMLIGVFELLADAREQIASVISTIEAQREFWLAETTLRYVAIADTGDRAEPPSLGILAGGE